MAKSLDDARREMFQEAYKGVTCPCCEQRVQVYPRIITSSMAYGLILVEREQVQTGRWVHIPSFFAGSPLDPALKATLRGDFAKLSFWELVAKMQGDRPDGSRRNGYYAVTPKGSDFIHKKLVVPKIAYVYNQKLLGMSDGVWAAKEEASIIEALDSRFNYAELMGWKQ